MKTLTVSMTALMFALIASTASADAIWLRVAPGDTPTPGGTVEIQLVADTAIDGWRIEGATAPAGTSVSNFKVHALAGMNGNHEAMPNFVDNLTYGGRTYLFNEAFCEGNRGTMPAGDTLMSFDLDIHSTWDGVTPFTLDLLGSGEMYYYDAEEDPLEMEWNPHGSFWGTSPSTKLPIADLTIVPEPATMALLGLGGLALLGRRNRR